MNENEKSRSILDVSQEIEHRRGSEYGDILNILPDIVYKITPDGIFTYLSEAVGDLGYTVDELIGKHFSEIIHPDDIATVSREHVLERYKGRITGAKRAPGFFNERRGGKRITKNLIFRLLSKEQKERLESEKEEIKTDEIVYAEVMACGIYEKNHETGENTFIGTVGVIRNITERLRLMDEKVHLEEQLFQSQKMEALGQLAGGVAHDYNNILGAISGYADIISRRFGADNPKLRKYAEVILTSASRAAELTDRLLQFARKGEKIKESHDLHSIIADTVELLLPTLDKSITITKKFHEGDSVVLVDQNQIQNAILNIALNARDAMPVKGELVFRTENVFLEHDSMSSYGQKMVKGAYCVLSITDTGTGMPEEVKRRIFEPFFTTKDIGKGTGLGLSSVYGILDTHNGIIDVQSVPGTGTAFILYIPLVEQRVRERKSYLKTAEQSQQDNGHVLIIDSNEVMMETCADILRTLGFTANRCNSSMEAANYYQYHYKKIDLVIIAMRMPNSNGLACFKQLQRINPQIRAIGTTYFVQDKTVEELLHDGAAGSVQKPYIAEELSRVVMPILQKELK